MGIKTEDSREKRASERKRQCQLDRKARLNKARMTESTSVNRCEVKTQKNIPVSNTRPILNENLQTEVISRKLLGMIDELKSYVELLTKEVSAIKSDNLELRKVNEVEENLRNEFVISISSLRNENKELVERIRNLEALWCEAGSDEEMHAEEKRDLNIETGNIADMKMEDALDSNTQTSLGLPVKNFK